MNIGTAKPDLLEMHEIPHHFIDFISIRDNYNAGKFETDVLKFLEKYFLRNNIALLVGGSGLYVKTVCEGMDKIPPSDKIIREKLNEELKINGIESLLEKLKSLDKDYFKVVDKKNPHRIIRALEVCLVSGLPYSSFRIKDNNAYEMAEVGSRPVVQQGRRGERKKNRDFNIIKIGLELPRQELYERINKRVDEMIDKGLVDEARKLFPFRNLNALQTVGYEELFEYFENKIPLEKAIGLIKQNTRRFAKRQMTWFRKDKEINWFHPQEKEKIFSFLKSY